MPGVSDPGCAAYPRSEVDEAWVREWCKFGFVEMRAYMQKYARFERWLARHNRASWSS